jgi:hypothetical protein
MVEYLDVEDAVLKIRQDGISSDLRLRPDALEELLSFCWTAPCFGDGKPDYGFRYGDKGIDLACQARQRESAYRMAAAVWLLVEGERSVLSIQWRRLSISVRRAFQLPTIPDEELATVAEIDSASSLLLTG